MLQKVAGLVILALGISLLTCQIMIGDDMRIMLAFLAIALTVFGGVVNLAGDLEEPHERL